MCFVYREHTDGTSVDLDTLHELNLEPDELLIILGINTDDIPLLYTENTRHMVEISSAPSNLSYKCTPPDAIEYYPGMHIIRDREQRVLSIDVRRHIYGFIRSMGLDPNSLVACHIASFSKLLHPNTVYSKDDCPKVIEPRRP